MNGSLEVFNLWATDDPQRFLGIGVSFPNAGVYFDWNLEAFDEDQRLDHPHVSQYGSLEDVQLATGGDPKPIRVVPVGEIGGRTS